MRSDCVTASACLACWASIPRVLQAAISYDVLSRAAPSSSAVVRDASSGPCACSSSSCAASSSTRRAPGRGSVAAARGAASPGAPVRAARARTPRVVLRQRTIELRTAAVPALRARRGPRQARTVQRYSRMAAPARLNARANACTRGQRAPPWRGVLLDSLALMLAVAKAQQGIVVQRAWRA